MENIEDVMLRPELSLRDLIDLYRKIHGFMPSHLVRAIDIIKKMLREADLRVLTFTGNIVATGVRGIIAQLIREKVFNLVITTCGAIDHDIARSFGARYFKGYFEVDDRELFSRGIHRLGNVFIRMEDYGPLIERKVFEILDKISSESNRQRWGVRELLHEFGKHIEDQNSILRAAVSSNVPIYVPGFLDGAFGTALFMYSRFHRLEIDVFKDMMELADKFFTAKKIGALIIGGGISKHHAIWWSQFREGLDYVVYITTAVEWDGSLSGAHPREAITWGKVKPSAEHVVIYGDATLILPILAYGILYT